MDFEELKLRLLAEAMEKKDRLEAEALEKDKKLRRKKKDVRP